MKRNLLLIVTSRQTSSKLLLPSSHHQVLVRLGAFLSFRDMQQRDEDDEIKNIIMTKEKEETMINRWFRRMSAKNKRKRRHSKNRRSLSVEWDRHRMDSSRVLEWRSPVDDDSNEEIGLEQPWSSHRERTDWWDYCFERVPIDSNWRHHWSMLEPMVVYSDSQLLLPVDQRAMERNSSATHY